jgi:hypothetical protein
MDRPLREVELPVTKYKAKIVTFFTRGESKELRQVLDKDKKVKYINDEIVIEDIPANIVVLKEDALLKVGIKALFDDKGASISIVDNTMDDLPDKDVSFLLKELRKVGREEKEEKKE